MAAGVFGALDVCRCGFLSQSGPRGGQPSKQSRLELGLRCTAMDSRGRTIWIADAHRDDGKRFVVRADEKLTAFMELESAIRACASKTRLNHPSPSQHK
jgi:hypothetical protein